MHELKLTNLNMFIIYNDKVDDSGKIETPLLVNWQKKNSIKSIFAEIKTSFKICFPLVCLFVYFYLFIFFF
jgi:hypothetical protein